MNLIEMMGTLRFAHPTKIEIFMDSYTHQIAAGWNAGGLQSQGGEDEAVFTILRILDNAGSGLVYEIHTLTKSVSPQ